jgi:hypothetical protein
MWLHASSHSNVHNSHTFGRIDRYVCMIVANMMSHREIYPTKSRLSLAVRFPRGRRSNDRFATSGMSAPSSTPAPL